MLFDRVHFSMLCRKSSSFAYSPMVGESQDLVADLVLSRATNPSCNRDSAVMVGSVPSVSDNPRGWVPSFLTFVFLGVSLHRCAN